MNQFAAKLVWALCEYGLTVYEQNVAHVKETILFLHDIQMTDTKVLLMDHILYDDIVVQSTVIFPP